MGTVFEYSATVRFEPAAEEEKAGMSVFLILDQHINLGIVWLRDAAGKLSPHFRFHVEASGRSGLAVPETVVEVVPAAWRGRLIVLCINISDDSSFALSAVLEGVPRSECVLGKASAQIVSGGSGQPTGTLLGVYDE
ncbi:hypothetical protein AnigIFM50267_004291 [Aspergillus niger]|nr:hypothetical protein AnigIFM50267_004291 [Aspergillus niger]